jgi:hypothetical protein
MQQPIEQRDDAGGVWENLVPFLKRPVSSEVDWLALRRFLGAPLKPSRVIPQIRRVPADTQPLPFRSTKLECGSPAAGVYRCGRK